MRSSPRFILLALSALATVSSAFIFLGSGLSPPLQDCKRVEANERSNGNALSCTGQAAWLYNYTVYMEDSYLPTACPLEPATAPKYMAAIPDGNKHCGEKIKVTNPHNRKEIEVTVVDLCMTDCDPEYSSTSIALGLDAYHDLFGEEVNDGVYDVEYDEL